MWDIIEKAGLCSQDTKMHGQWPISEKFALQVILGKKAASSLYCISSLPSPLDEVYSP